MECHSCGVANAPARRYCRECGCRLGQPCAFCNFFNSLDDKHCGGCGRRLPGVAGGEASQAAGFAPAFAADPGCGRGAAPAPTAGAGLAGVGVSHTEIDGLLESILEDVPGGEGG
jgi:hypothetical protein